MFDIHSHILYGIDDGAKTINDSIDILKEMFSLGYTDIVLTPHYIIDSKYDAKKNVKEKELRELKKILKKENIKINLYLGNEVYLDIDVLNKLNDISTINNSKYILVELPLHYKNPMALEIISLLINKGLIPIIAHPERYSSYYKDYEFFIELVNMGCILQGNIGSMYNNYGRKAKKMLKELLKRNLIGVVGSDIHHKNSSILNKNIKKDLFKIVKSYEKVEDLTKNNISKIIKNKEI